MSLKRWHTLSSTWKKDQIVFLRGPDGNPGSRCYFVRFCGNNQSLSFHGWDENWLNELDPSHKRSVARNLHNRIIHQLIHTDLFSSWQIQLNERTLVIFFVNCMPTSHFNVILVQVTELAPFLSMVIQFDISAHPCCIAFLIVQFKIQCVVDYLGLFFASEIVQKWP